MKTNNQNKQTAEFLEGPMIESLYQTAQNQYTTTQDKYNQVEQLNRYVVHVWLKLLFVCSDYWFSSPSIAVVE